MEDTIKINYSPENGLLNVYVKGKVFPVQLKPDQWQEIVDNISTIQLGLAQLKMAPSHDTDPPPIDFRLSNLEG